MSIEIVKEIVGCIDFCVAVVSTCATIVICVYFAFKG